MKTIILAVITLLLQPGVALAVAGSHNADSGGDPLNGPVSLVGLLIVGGLFWFFGRK